MLREVDDLWTPQHGLPTPPLNSTEGAFVATHAPSVPAEAHPSHAVDSKVGTDDVLPGDAPSSPDIGHRRRVQRSSRIVVSEGATSVVRPRPFRMR